MPASLLCQLSGRGAGAAAPRRPGCGRAGDRPYLISGADDRLVKVWDYQTKACVQTLEGHTHNVSAVCFHPELPIIVSGSEDGSVRVWHATTYRLENTLSYGLERLWALGYARGSNLCAPAAPRPPAHPRRCVAGAAGLRRSAGLADWGLNQAPPVGSSGCVRPCSRNQWMGLHGLAAARPGAHRDERLTRRARAQRGPGLRRGHGADQDWARGAGGVHGRERQDHLGAPQ